MTFQRIIQFWLLNRWGSLDYRKNIYYKCLGKFFHLQPNDEDADVSRVSEDFSVDKITLNKHKESCCCLKKGLKGQ